MAELRLARDDLTRRVAGLEDELAQVRREHAEELVRRDAERETALAGRDEEMAQAADDRVAEIEAEVAEARRALRAARAETEGIRRELERERERTEAAEAAVRRGRVTEIAGEPVDDDDQTERFQTEEQTARLRTNGAEATAPGDAAPTTDDHATEVATLERPEPVEGDPGETVRVLGSRRPRRTGEGPPAEAAPGTAAIGARHIEPGQTKRSALAAWLARVVAFLALTVVVVAVLMVLKPF